MWKGVGIIIIKKIGLTVSVYSHLWNCACWCASGATHGWRGCPWVSFSGGRAQQRGSGSSAPSGAAPSAPPAGPPSPQPGSAGARSPSAAADAASPHNRCRNNDTARCPSHSLLHLIGQTPRLGSECLCYGEEHEGVIYSCPVLAWWMLCSSVSCLYNNMSYSIQLKIQENSSPALHDFPQREGGSLNRGQV